METKAGIELFRAYYDEYYLLKPNKRPHTISQLNEIINDITSAKSGANKTRRDYYLLKAYDVVTENGEKHVIKKVQTLGDPVIYIIPEEKIYQKLLDVHISCEHGSRDKMIHIINQSCAIPRPCVEMFLKSCKLCLSRKKPAPKTFERPSTCEHFMTRGHVELIDLQSTADGNFKWLLIFQDDVTKYICLRPLQSKKSSEVAQELLKIFLQFGAPLILQSDNGLEFVNTIIDELKIMWPQLCVVQGRIRHHRCSGHVKNMIQNVERMLRSWMLDNQSTVWSTGCHFVQWQMNNLVHEMINRSPYEALFGNDPKINATIKVEDEIETTDFEISNTLECEVKEELNMDVCIGDENEEQMKMPQ